MAGGTHLPIKGNINAQLACLTGSDLNKQANMLLIQHRQAAQSKQNKQDVSHTVILPLKLVFSEA